MSKQAVREKEEGKKLDKIKHQFKKEAIENKEKQYLKNWCQ
jgi:hypothetical protein